MDFGYKIITLKKGIKLQISLLSDFLLINADSNVCVCVCLLATCCMIIMKKGKVTGVHD